MLPEVASYDQIVRGGHALMQHLLQKERSLIIDEGHYLRHLSRRTVQILGKDGYARRCQHVWIGSGTPTPKHPAELWPTLAALWPQLMADHGLFTRVDFEERFCVKKYMGIFNGRPRYKVMAVQNEDNLKEILAEIMLRRTLADLGGDVPTLDWQITRVDSTDVYVEDMVRKLPLDDLESIAQDMHIARMRRRLGALKAGPVIELITSEMRDEPTRKIAVFAHHRTVLTELADQLFEFEPAYIDGDTPPTERDIQLDAFQNDPNCRIFIGQNLACQTGIRLDAADTAILVEPDWTRDVNVQLANRIVDAARPGRRCVVQFIALANTLDEAIIATNKREAEMAYRIYAEKP